MNYLISDNSQRIPKLDGLRGVAILLVLIWHYIVSPAKLESIPTPLYIILGLLILTWSGVDLFFVLSGFLIGGILLDNKQADNYYKAFYARRAYRILPLYFLWLILFIILSLVIPNVISEDSPIASLFKNSLPLWSYATFTQNIVMSQNGTFGASWMGITWSLAVEEQFYLLIPLILRFIRKDKLPYFLLFFIVLSPIIRVILFYIHPQSGFASGVLMPARMDALLLGVFCAFISRQKQTMNYLVIHKDILYRTLTILIIGTVFLIFISPVPLSFVMISFGFSWLALLYVNCLMITLIEKDGIISSILRLPILGKLGQIAYGVYIFHQAINVLGHWLILRQLPQISTLSDLLVTLGSTFATIMIAYISWEFFEKRFVKIGRSFSYYK